MTTAIWSVLVSGLISSMAHAAPVNGELNERFNHINTCRLQIVDAVAGGTSICSGTVIGAKTILTSAHCFQREAEHGPSILGGAEKEANASPAAEPVYDTADAIQNGFAVPGKGGHIYVECRYQDQEFLRFGTEVEIHANYVKKLPANEKTQFDLAVLTIDLDLPFEPVEVITQAAELVSFVDEGTCFFSGWGLSNGKKAGITQSSAYAPFARAPVSFTKEGVVYDTESPALLFFGGFLNELRMKEIQERAKDAGKELTPELLKQITRFDKNSVDHGDSGGSLYCFKEIGKDEIAFKLAGVIEAIGEDKRSVIGTLIGKGFDGLHLTNAIRFK